MFTASSTRYYVHFFQVLMALCYHAFLDSSPTYRKNFSRFVRFGYRHPTPKARLSSESKCPHTAPNEAHATICSSHHTPAELEAVSRARPVLHCTRDCSTDHCCGCNFLSMCHRKQLWLGHVRPVWRDTKRTNKAPHPDTCRTMTIAMRGMQTESPYTLVFVLH